MRTLVAALFLTSLAADSLAQGFVATRRFERNDAARGEVVPRRDDPIGLPPPTGQRRDGMQMKSHRVRIEIENGAAIVHVTQVFHNPHSFQLEGIYLFPLPANASVSRFTMSMAGRQVTGDIVESDKAREIYTSIVTRRRDPGLLEYVGRRTIRARLFPIPARGDTKVELRYEQVLDTVGGVRELTYPLRTNRFAPGPVHASVSIAVRSSAGVGTLYSPTHQLDVRKSGAHDAKASWEASRYPADRDLRLFYGVGKKDFGLSLVTHKPRGEDGSFLMLVSPGAADGGAPVLPKDTVFVLDTSGSMGENGGRKLAQAKAALKYAIGRLAAKDRFNIIDFSTDARVFRNRPVAATQENIAAARKYVEGLSARGGTAIHEALLMALALPREAGRVPIVIFLTDGQPTIGPADPGAILGAVARKNSARARVFVFGVGNDVNTRLLDDLADQTRGLGHYVAEEEDIEHKVSVLCEKIANPVMTDLTVSIAGVGEFDVYPKRLGDLFRGQQITLVGRYKNAGARAITLKGRIGDREVTHVFEATFGDDGGREYLGRLWAVRKVGHLMREIRKNGEHGELVGEIRRLGIKHGIVTPYTSFLAVEAQEALRRKLGAGSIRGRRMPDREKRSILSAIDDLERVRGQAGDAGEAIKKDSASGAPAVAGARLTKALQDAPNVGGLTGVGVRTRGAKTFRYREGVWVGQALESLGKKKVAELDVVKVKFLGQRYLALVKDSKLARLLSVGSLVRVLHDGTIYVITAS